MGGGTEGSVLVIVVTAVGGGRVDSALVIVVTVVGGGTVDSALVIVVTVVGGETAGSVKVVAVAVVGVFFATVICVAVVGAAGNVICAKSVFVVFLALGVEDREDVVEITIVWSEIGVVGNFLVTVVIIVAKLVAETVFGVED